MQNTSITKLKNAISKNFLDVGPSTAQIKELILDVFVAANKQEVNDIIFFKKDRVAVSFKKDGLTKLYREVPESLSRYFMLNIQTLGNIKASERGIVDTSSRLSNQFVKYRVAQVPISTTGLLITYRQLFQHHLRGDCFSQQYKKAVLDSLMTPGLVIISGSTSSRKSTFISSVLTSDLLKNKNIISIEDPLEYEIKNVKQVELGDKCKVDAGLKAVLRHSPDIIYIGEVRDSETAKIAIEASKSGHAIITTTHSSSVQAVSSRWINEFNILREDIESYVTLTSHHTLNKGEVNVQYR